MAAWWGSPLEDQLMWYIAPVPPSEKMSSIIPARSEVTTRGLRPTCSICPTMA